MCGILGGNNPSWNYKKGIECMRHRGPDGIRISRGRDFTLAFARLAIMDLSDRGMQSMYSPDGQVGIVFNGEIYGFQKLRKQLEKKGYLFQSSSDTEVILNAYLEWGEKYIAKIDGMYGIAILDYRDKAVKLYRDRIGIKPLYYYYNGNDFGFSSELKGIVNMCEGVSFAVDNTAVYDYLQYRYIPEPKTYYKNVYKLQPGHCLIFDLCAKRIVRDKAYWKLRPSEYQGQQRKQSDLIEELKYLVQESVREQMVADVPVGSFLSGGVDSSIVTYEGYQINPLLETFSVGFTRKEYDELKFVQQLAERYQFRTNIATFEHRVFQEYYKQMRTWYDEPFADTSAYPTHLVSKAAKEKVTVVLTGDGGDEVFGGYWRHHMLWQKEKEHAPDNLLISAIYNRLKKSGAKKYYWMDDLSFLIETYRWPLKSSDRELRERLRIPRDYDRYWVLRKHYFKNLPPMTRVQYVDLKTYLPGDILAKVDRASMAVSLEARVPFLSKKLVEFAFSLSEEDRCPGGMEKGLLKKAYEKEIGKELLYRSKKGFCMPTNYFKASRSPQEVIWEQLWKSGKG